MGAEVVLTLISLLLFGSVNGCGAHGVGFVLLPS